MAGCISKAVVAAGALLRSENRGGGIIDPDPPNLQKEEKDLACMQGHFAKFLFSFLLFQSSLARS
mgnify:CR=1 FL=1